MAFEVEVPVRHRTMWLAFTDPEKMARAVPGLTVDAVHAVPPADGPEGVAGDVVAGRLKLKVGSGAGAAITYRGTACIAGAEAHKGTLDIAVDAAQARGNGALAGYLRVTLAQAGEDGERTLVTVVPELELSGRALEFTQEDWHGAVEALGAAWIEVLAAQFDVGSATAVAEVAEAVEAAEPAVTAEPSEVATTAEATEVPERIEPAEPEPSNKEQESESESDKITNAEIPALSPTAALSDESLSEDPLAAVWNGRYEKNRWLPLITALALFLLIKRRRRHRADKPGADSSFRME
ncbi:carbon monoxide dehydrogenase subunit G [Catenulispora sp. EB89]|uniref:hypothetical protein n=1 Tax=Catenulispora sp. EB89 TaxID=3156257 RepID=UPI0035144485